MENKASGSDVPENYRMEIDLLAVGKRARLSFVEMNELRVKDLLALVGRYAGSEDDMPREATQADIDAFYA